MPPVNLRSDAPSSTSGGESVLKEEMLAPITSSIGFLQAPPQEVAAVWASAEHGGGSVRIEQLPGGLVEEFDSVLPLTFGSHSRRLVIATDSDWSAIVDCGANGSDPYSFVGHMHRRMGVNGLVATHVSPSTHPLRYGAVQLHMFSPDAPGLGYLRTIDAIQDGESRWSFHLSGSVQPFEEEAAYARRGVRDRFTPELLEQYVASLGIRLFDPTFYAGPSVLTEEVHTRAVRSISFADARVYRGYAP